MMTTMDSQKSLLEFLLDPELKCHACRQPGLYYDSSLDDIERLWFLGGYLKSHAELDRHIKEWTEVSVDDANHPNKVARDRNLALSKAFKAFKESGDLRGGLSAPSILHGPRMQALQSFRHTFLTTLVVFLIPPLANLVLEYCPQPWVRYLHVIEETIPLPEALPSVRLNTLIIEKWFKFLHDLDDRLKQSKEWKTLYRSKLVPARWDAFPDTKRVKYVSNAIDHKMDRKIPQLGSESGTWTCRRSQGHNTVSRNTLLCRECIFAVARTDKMCPWLFDEDLFGEFNALRYNAVYDDYVCKEFFSSRRSVELTLKRM